MLVWMRLLHLRDRSIEERKFGIFEVSPHGWTKPIGDALCQLPIDDAVRLHLLEDTFERQFVRLQAYELFCCQVDSAKHSIKINGRWSKIGEGVSADRVLFHRRD